jgi:hypothetical protein
MACNTVVLCLWDRPAEGCTPLGGSGVPNLASVLALEAQARSRPVAPGPAHYHGQSELALIFNTTTHAPRSPPNKLPSPFSV